MGGAKPTDPPWHPAAELFPMMSDERLRALADDIRAHGQRDAIVLLAGQILDGRNRYRACALAGVEPRFDHANTLEIGDPWAYVASKNYHRRDLTESQRAMVGTKLKERFAAQAKERQRKGASAGGKRAGKLPQNSTEASEAPGDARQRAADAVNVSTYSIDAATKVMEDGVPALVAAVEHGEVSVSAAAAVAAPEAEPWDVALTIGELNSALLEIEHQCPAADVPMLAAFLEGWATKLKERVHVSAA